MAQSAGNTESSDLRRRHTKRQRPAMTLRKYPKHASSERFRRHRIRTAIFAFMIAIATASATAGQAAAEPGHDAGAPATATATGQ